MNSPADSCNAAEALIDSMAECLTPEVLAAMASQKLSPLGAQRMGELAEKANEGLLSAVEKEEYEQSIAISHILTILRLKARLRFRDAA